MMAFWFDERALMEAAGRKHDTEFASSRKVRALFPVEKIFRREGLAAI
jgi:hypothetical protein